jgi:hypothetical protein
MPPDVFSIEHSKRCNTIFWITYIIDQEFGPLVGAPSSIRPEDISANLPSEIDRSIRGAALTLQVRMSRLTATILTGKRVLLYLSMWLIWCRRIWCWEGFGRLVS